jgi:hypothetical protein
MSVICPTWLTGVASAGRSRSEHVSAIKLNTPHPKKLTQMNPGKLF